jgi:mannose/fructose-specific phosphotransferase system component IIA
VLSYLGLSWDDDLATAKAKIRAALDRLASGSEGTLVLVDMVGSTPCNAARALTEERPIEVVAGVNLPMVVRLACGASVPESLRQAAEWLIRKTQGTICIPEQQDPAPCEPGPGGKESYGG